jgi:hypothetical protein
LKSFIFHRDNQKIFVTEDKMVKEMQTLSLDLAGVNNTNQPSSTPLYNSTEPIGDKIPSSAIEDDSSEDDEKDNKIQETRFELHKLLRERLKEDDLQDNLITKLCEIERLIIPMKSY